MDKASLERQLTLTQARITEFEIRIDRKVALVDDLNARGVAAQVEVKHLSELRRAHALRIGDRKRILRELSRTS